MGAGSAFGLRVGFLLALLPSSSARAFECTSTEKNDFVSIRWMSVPVPYAIRSGSTEVSPSFAEDAVRRSFSRWTQPRCTHMRFEYRGVVEASTELREVSQVIFVQEDWTHERDAVGLTTMTYSTVDGRISFGKIEINEALYRFGDTDQSCGMGQKVFDLESVLTHEVGHFIGLAHVAPPSDLPSEAAGAPTMSPRVIDCDSAFRSLETDDQDGLCFIYPTGLRARGCDRLPPQTKSYVSNVPFGCRAGGSRTLWVIPLLLLFRARDRGKRRRRACSEAVSAR